MKGRAFVVFLGMTLVAPALALSQSPPWTAAGPTGMPDEAFVQNYRAQTGALSYIGFSSSPQDNFIRLYFNVTDTSASGYPAWSSLELSYFDDSPNSEVKATLYRLDRCNGTRKTECTVTSRDAAGPTCGRCTFTNQIDFYDYTYYVEVDISRSMATLDPKLFALRIY